jgi:hypothetical protein
MRTIILYAIFLIICLLIAMAGSGKMMDGKAVKLSSALKHDTVPAEKVYLHVDKPYYHIGDTIWFKAYVTNDDLRATSISKFVYVELDSDSAELVDRVKIRIENGVACGQLPIRKIQYQEGGYTLRAYTYWMKNFGADYDYTQRFFFSLPSTDTWLVRSDAAINRIADKDQLQVSLWLNRNDKLISPVALKKVEVKIYDEGHYLFKETLQTGLDGSLKFSGTLADGMNGRQIRVQITALDKAENNRIIKVPLIVNRSQKIDLQFLPESGKLVNGINSWLAFKAVGEDGRPADVTGVIRDSKGNSIINFKSLHNGMGSLEFLPEDGETYTARIEQPVGVLKSYPLPGIATMGTVIHIENEENATALTVTLAGLGSLPADSSFSLIGIAKGKILYGRKVEATDTEIMVDKTHFPTGIVKFILFRGHLPLNERAIFVDHHDHLSISIKPHRAKYAKRDSVSLSIQVKNDKGEPVQGDFSLAVTDDSQVQTDTLGNYSIAASLLLNADLKGQVESPGYYLYRSNKNAWKALDNLMLTQGWTSYSWKDVYSSTRPIRFLPEKDMAITGRVSNVLNKGVAGAQVLVSSQKPGFVKTIQADENGIFTFTPPAWVDTNSYFFQANNNRGKFKAFGLTEIKKSIPMVIPRATTFPVSPWYVNSNGAFINYAKRRTEEEDLSNLKVKGILLKEVKIKEKKIIKGSMNPYGPGEADYVFDENDIKKSGLTNLYDFLKHKLPNFRVHGQVDDKLDINSAYPIFSFNHWPLDPPNMDGNPLKVSSDETERGIEGTIEELSKIQLGNIRGIELAYSRKYTNKSALVEKRFRSNDFAKLEITSKNGNGWARYYKNNNTSYRPWPITAPKEFYSPKYNVKQTVTNPDYRPTLLWQPNIITDAEGKAMVSFYTSDSADKYTLKIAGFDGAGSIGDATIKLTVGN